MENLKLKLQNFFRNRTNLILTVVLAVIVLGGIGGVVAFINRTPTDLPIEEHDLTFNPDGPYTILLPRRDGNAIFLNLNRGSGLDAFSYELVYQADNSEIANLEGEEGSTIDRGAGVLDTYINLKGKTEYSQLILFGTCSKGATEDPLHCVFDKNVQNGSLTVNLKEQAKKGDETQKVYKWKTTWHHQKPDVALGKLVSADEHFKYTINAEREKLVAIGYSLIHELSGAPKLPEDKQFMGLVYTVNVPTARTLPAGDVSIETFDAPPQDAKIGWYNEKENRWDLLESKVEKNTVSAKASEGGIFAVLVNK